MRAMPHGTELFVAVRCVPVVLYGEEDEARTREVLQRVMGPEAKFHRHSTLTRTL